jgi:hypothetical protein
MCTRHIAETETIVIWFVEGGDGINRLQSAFKRTIFFCKAALCKECWMYPSMGNRLQYVQ